MTGSSYDKTLPPRRGYRRHLYRCGAGGAGVFESLKVLTTYDAPENAILDGVTQVCAKAEIDPGQIHQMIHGTTLATNALISREGAKTALVTTQGFRDVIEMRTESRFEQYDLNLDLPKPLLPRNRRYTLKERMDAGGNLNGLDLAGNQSSGRKP